MSDSSDSVWVYSPSFPLAIIGTVLYGGLFFYITFLTIRYRAWFFLTVVIGATVEVVGYAMRAYAALNKTEIGPAAVTQTLIVIAPIFIAAGNFLLLGRLVRAVLPPTQHKIFRVHARFITRLFVTCDVIAAIVQGSGTSIAGSNEWTGDTKDIGEKVILGGLAFQSLSFAAYLCILIRFDAKAKTIRSDTAPVGWRNVIKAVYISSFMILIRCTFRIAEFAEGIDGYAFRNEWLFWVFECVPIAISIGVFCVWYPSKYLGRDGAKKLITSSLEAGDASELVQSSRRRRRNETR